MIDLKSMTFIYFQFLTAKEQVYVINLSMRDCLRENDKYTTRLVTNMPIDVETGLHFQLF